MDSEELLGVRKTVEFSNVGMLTKDSRVISVLDTKRLVFISGLEKVANI